MTTALLLKIGADVSSMQGDLNKAKAQMNGFTADLKKLGGMVATAFSVGAVVAFGKEAYQAAALAIDGENQLLHALKGRVDVQKRLMEQADELHNTTLFEDDEIIAQQALLAALGRNEQQIKKIIAAAVQLSVATKTDLGSAVEALGKTYDGIGTKLGKIDPQFKELTDTQLRHGEAVDMVIAKYEGYAEAAAKAGSGPMTMMKKHLDDIIEGYGRSLLPLLNDSTSLLENHGISWQDVGTALGDATFWFPQLILNLTGVSEVAEDGTKKLNAYGQALAALEENAPQHQTFRQAFAVKTETIATLTKKLAEYRDKQQDASGQELISINREIKSLEDKIKKLKELGIARNHSTPPPAAAMAVVAPTVSTDLKDYGFLSEEDYVEPIEGMQKYFDEVMPELAETAKGMEYIFIDMSQNIQGALAGLAVGLGESIGNMIAGVGGIEQIAAAVVGGLGNMAMQLGQTMIQFGLAGLALKKFAITPGAAIAAGVALVALGRVLSAKATGIAGGGGSSGSGGGASSPAGALTKIQYGNRVEVTGEFELRNDRLVAAIRNENRRTERTLPTSRG